ncbi:hypothetical protein EWM64_g6066 [Hericium alpestre]|uniref:F-box domain-containing protein n=1 Tax=Hericium alpestre TaxID=135208 RepID=A0A4Y9ZST1_9AGAM|nr:hypothetical protein EWM64_g6066 [Hericium alpestre]
MFSFGTITVPLSPQVIQSPLYALMNLFSVPMPLLDFFWLDNIGSLLPDPPDMHMLDPSRFLSETSRLYFFSLRGCRLLGPLPLSINLTTLDLAGFYNTNTHEPTTPGMALFRSFTDLMQTLQNVPNVVSLNLDCNLFRPAQSNHCFWPYVPVRLASLTRLVLRGTVFECAIILKNLSLPSSARLQLECLEMHDRTDIDRLLAEWTSITHNLRDDAPFFSVWVSLSHDGFALKVERSYSDDTLKPRIPTPRICLFAVDLSGEYLPAFLGALGNAHIRTLSVGGPDLSVPYSEETPVWKVADWALYFASCDEVRHLRVGGGVSAKALACLLASSDLFPRLRSLWLCEFDLAAWMKAVGGGEVEITVKWLEGPTLEWLKQASARRDHLRIYLIGSVLDREFFGLPTSAARSPLNYDEFLSFIPGGFPDDYIQGGDV